MWVPQVPILGPGIGNRKVPNQLVSDLEFGRVILPFPPWPQKQRRGEGEAPSLVDDLDGQ